MAITLRQTDIDTGGKATELSYQQMNDNLKSFYYSSSLASNTLKLHFLSGSTSHSIDLSSYLDNTNIYNIDGELIDDRVVDQAGYGLTFSGIGAFNTFDVSSGGRFLISGSTNVKIDGLQSGTQANVLGIDNQGLLYIQSTGSISTGDTHIGNTSFNLTGNRTLGLNNYSLTFDALNGESINFTIENTGDFTIALADSSTVNFTGLNTGTSANVLGYNTSTGEITYYSTASFGGGSATPGGSTTQVQFNDGGAFGGDSGFLYDKTNNKLTVVSAGTGATTNPTIQLGTSDVSIAPGDTVGRISFSNTDSTYGGATSYAAIYAVAPSNWGGGNYPKDVRIAAVASAATVDVATFKGSGVVQLHDYGSGNNTGTAAKWLAVDSSGNMIEENAPSSRANVTRPGSNDQDITFIEILANQQAAWNLQSTSGATPTSTNVTTDSATVSSITALKIHHTADTSGSFTGDIATALDQLAYGGTVQIGDTGSPSNYATATVRQVVDNGTYHTIYTSAWNSTGLTTLSGVFGLLIGFDTDKIVVLDDKNYNRIRVNNDCGNTIGLRFKANASASPGDYYYVEVTANSANSDNMLFEYIHNTSGTGDSYVEATNNIYYHNNAATLTQLNVNSTYQQAVVEFRVTPSGHLALMGADKVLR